MMASPRQRPRTADPESRYSFLGTRRSFPLVGRKKSKSGISLTPERPSTSHHPLSPPPSLRVRLSLRSSAGSDHNADVQASPSFDPSDQVCQALLRRLQHCSAEVVTRRDRTALDPPSVPSQSRPMRFQITCYIARHGLHWAEETLSSYQQNPMDADLEREIMDELRLSATSFLTRHDPGFCSTGADATAVPPETSRPSIGLPQPMCCVPHETQSPSTPGYLIELFLRRRCHVASKVTSFRIGSRQSSPLTILLGEDVLSKTTKLLDAAFEERKIRFEEIHRWCDGLEGDGGCNHVIDGAFDVLVKIRNNIGPDYNHLSHRLQTYRILFDDDEAQEFEDFSNSLKEQLEGVRDLADRGLDAVDDMTFTIRKLEVPGHLIPKPLSVSLDSSITYNRAITQTLTSRVPAGLRQVLEGSGATISLTLHKRGHLILDTTVEDPSRGASDGEMSLLNSDELLTKLRNELQADVSLVCKDTLSIDSSDAPLNLNIFDGRTAASDDNRPSTSGPMMPEDPPVTPTRHSLLKRKARTNLRQSLLTESTIPPATSEFIEAHGYMAGLISDDGYLSDESSTPSLVDTDSISPNDSLLITPETNRIGNRGLPNFGLRLMDDEMMGSPISTQDILSRGDEGHAAYDPPPFPSMFRTLKSSPGLPVSLSQEDIQTVVPSKIEDDQLASDLMSLPESSRETSGQQMLPDLVKEEDFGHFPFEETNDFHCSDVKEHGGESSPKSVPAPTLDFNCVDGATHVEASAELSKMSPMTSKEIKQDPFTDGRIAEGFSDAAAAAPAIDTLSALRRPSISTTNERPKSSALILRPNLGSIGAVVRQQASGVRAYKPERRWSNPRPFPPRRQFSSATAGYLGLHGEYLVPMGLVNAVIPSHLRSTPS
jgi:hypothetical protein